MTHREFSGIFRERYCYRSKECARCHEAFVEGDRIVSRNRGKHHRVAYHKKCWEAMQV